MSVIFRLVLLSILIGVILKVMGLDPFNILRSIEDLFRAIMKAQIERLDAASVLKPREGRPVLEEGLKAYANHMLRSAYVAMQKVASEILRCGRTLEIEPYCTKIDEILDLIPGTR